MTETEILRELVKSQEALIRYLSFIPGSVSNEFDRAIEKEEAIIENLKLDLVPFERQKV